MNEWILRDVALWIKSTYGDKLAIFITENGRGANETSVDDYNTRAVYHSVSTDCKGTARFSAQR